MTFFELEYTWRKRDTIHKNKIKSNRNPEGSYVTTGNIKRGEVLLKARIENFIREMWQKKYAENLRKSNMPRIALDINI